MNHGSYNSSHELTKKLSESPGKNFEGDFGGRSEEIGAHGKTNLGINKMSVTPKARKGGRHIFGRTGEKPAKDLCKRYGVSAIRYQGGKGGCYSSQIVILKNKNGGGGKRYSKGGKKHLWRTDQKGDGAETTIRTPYLKGCLTRYKTTLFLKHCKHYFLMPEVGRYGLHICKLICQQPVKSRGMGHITSPKIKDGTILKLPLKGFRTPFKVTVVILNEELDFWRSLDNLSVFSSQSTHHHTNLSSCLLMNRRGEEFKIYVVQPTLGKFRRGKNSVALNRNTEIIQIVGGEPTLARRECSNLRLVGREREICHSHQEGNRIGGAVSDRKKKGDRLVLECSLIGSKIGHQVERHTQHSHDRPKSRNVRVGREFTGQPHPKDVLARTTQKGVWPAKGQKNPRGP